MATKTIGIRITGDASDAIGEVDKLEQSLKGVEREAKKASTELKDVGDNGGAIAILDELTGGLATKVRDAAEATKLFNFSLKGMRTALIATGIGAFVVAVGLVVAYWDEIDDYVKGTIRSLEKQLKAYEQITKELDHQLSINKLEKELAEIEGRSVAEIEKREREILVSKRENLKLSIDNLNTQLENEKSKIREVTLLEKGLIGLKAAIFGSQTVGGEVVRAFGFDVISEAQGKLDELKESLLQTEVNIARIDNPEGEEGASTTEGRKKIQAIQLEDFQDSKKAEIEYLVEHLTEKDRLEQEQHDRDLARISEGYNERVAAAESAAKATENIEIAKAKAIEQISRNVLNITGNLAKKGSAIAKGSAAAQATINTIKGITSALSAPTIVPDPLGSILRFTNAAAVGVAGFKAVKDILKTPPSISSASGIGSSVGGGGVPPAPAFNLVEGSASNQIADSIQQQNNPVRAYVVSTSVTSQQEMDRNIEAGAVL